MKSPAKPWLQRSSRLVALGMQNELRKRPYRLVLLLVAITSALVAITNARSASFTAVWLAETLGRPLGLLSCLWFGRYACRDLVRGNQTVLRTRAVDGAYLAGIQWATGVGLWLLLLATAFLPASAVQLPFSGPSAVASHLVALGRTALTISSMGSIAFALSRLLRSSAGGLITAAVWLLALSGALVGRIVQPEYTQNSVVLALGAACLWCAAVLLVERRRRGELRRPAVPAAVVAALFLGTAAAGARTVARQSPPDTLVLQAGIAEQSLQERQPLPGFWLPNGRKEWVKTSDYPGKALMVYLFEPGDLGAAPALDALDNIQRQYGPSGIQVIGVATSKDSGSVWSTVSQGRYHFPVGLDLSGADTNTGKASAGSALLRAYRAEQLPWLVVTDRSHLVTTIRGGTGVGPDLLRRIVEERLSAEPVMPSRTGAR